MPESILITTMHEVWPDEGLDKLDSLAGNSLQSYAAVAGAPGGPTAMGPSGL